MPTLLELKVYRFVCDFILFMIRAPVRTHWIGYGTAVHHNASTVTRLIFWDYLLLASVSSIIFLRVSHIVYCFMFTIHFQKHQISDTSFFLTLAAE